MKTKHEDKIIIEEEANPVFNDYRNRRIGSKGDLDIKRENGTILRPQSAKPEQRSKTPIVISSNRVNNNNNINPHNINLNNYNNPKPNANGVGSHYDKIQINRDNPQIVNQVNNR